MKMWCVDFSCVGKCIFLHGYKTLAAFLEYYQITNIFENFVLTRNSEMHPSSEKQKSLCLRKESSYFWPAKKPKQVNVFY